MSEPESLSIMIVSFLESNKSSEDSTTKDFDKDFSTIQAEDIGFSTPIPAMILEPAVLYFELGTGHS